MVEAISSMELGADMEEAAMLADTQAMGVSKATDMGTQGVAMAGCEGSETLCVHQGRQCASETAQTVFNLKPLHCKTSINAGTLQSLGKHLGLSMILI